MDWLDKMNNALEYIEDNLTGEIDTAEAARRACCSSFNFQRMFSFVTDVSLADYIRKRRLSLAAMELITTDEKVIDVAIKYGYDSPVSFTRAFTALHGVNPSDVRRSGVSVKSYPRISFQITIKGVNAMNYRIEEFGELRLVGVKERMYFENEQNLKRIPKFWNEVAQSEVFAKLNASNDNKDLCCIGVCANADDKGFDYYIATGSSKPLADGLTELIVPAATYVIFECIGKMPEGQQSVWKRIFSEWFPTSAYEMIDGPQMEWYSEGDMNSDSYRSEIWIPVKKK